MRTRIAASAVLAIAILSGTVGCGLMAPQATTIQYDASDGVSGDVGDVAIRNALLISDDGNTANLVVTIVNTGDSAHNLNVQYEAGTEKVTQSLTVDANSTVTLGTPDAPSITLHDIDTQPGALFPVYMQYGNETGVELLVPVLDGSIGQYSTLVPTPTPTLELQATPTATPHPNPDALAGYTWTPGGPGPAQASKR